MLTPEQITKIRTAAGATPTPPQPGTKSLADQLGLENPEMATETSGGEPSLGERVGSDINEAGQKIDQAVSGQGEYAGHSDVRRGFEAAAEGANTVVKVGSELLPKPVRDIAGKVGEAGGGMVNWLAEKLGNTELAKQIAASPQASKWIEETFGVAKAGGEIATDVLAADATAKGLQKGKELVQKGLQKSDTIINQGIDSAREKLTRSPQSEKVTDLLKQDPDTMTPTMKKEAIGEGRQTIRTTKAGGTEVDYVPTKEIQRAGEVMSDPEMVGKNTISPKDQPNVIYEKVKAGISKLGKNAETYLEENAVPVTNAEHADLFTNLRAEAEKSMTETQLGAYDEQMKLFSKQLVGRGEYNTANYYKALKEWESNVADTLPRGKEAIIGDPTGVASAKIHAAADIRTAIRDLIGSKHPEFQPKMYDLASLYEAKDNALFNASKIKTQTIFEKHPTATKVIKNVALIGGGAVVGKAIHVIP